jgi:regulator of protease activity HflC (stomatin/prohibitin superfamily)
MYAYFAPFAVFFALIVALAIIKASVKILREYERAVVFTLGRFQKVVLFLLFGGGGYFGRRRGYW